MHFKKMMVIFLLTLFINAPKSFISRVSASQIERGTHPMCTRASWASTDKCKDPAVATKNAPKDLKMEIERLASLTVTSLEELKKEISAWKVYAIGQYVRDKKTSDSYRVAVANCYKKQGLNYETYSGLIPNKCFDLWTKAIPPTLLSYPGGPKRDAWSKSWLDLATLAKTFPQFIQPSQLPLFINSYDNFKLCASKSDCYPVSLK